MKITKAEQQAIRQVIAAGAAYGYGNMIAHLQTAWAKSLMENYLMPEEDARKHSGGHGYSFTMQEDLLERGEWDETGKRYKRKK